MKKEELLSIGLTEEQADKVFALNGKDVERYKKAAEDAKTDKAAVKQQLADRDKDIEALKALDAEGLKKQMEALQQKYTNETDQYKAQLAERDYSDAVARAIADKGIKFSSKAAEKAYIADLKAKKLPLKDGALDGFEEYHKAQLEADPTAFQADKPAPTFAKPVGAGGPPAVESKGAMYAKQFNAQYAPKQIKEGQLNGLCDQLQGHVSPQFFGERDWPCAQNLSNPRDHGRSGWIQKNCPRRNAIPLQ